MGHSRLLTTAALSMLLLGSATGLGCADPAKPSAKAAIVAQSDAAPAASSQSKDAPADDSEVRISPLVWLPTANASVTIGDNRFNRTLSLDGTVTPSETLPNLHISFTGAIEGRSGRWGGVGEIFYISTSQPAKIAGVGGTLSNKMTLSQVSGFYRVIPGKVPVDLVAGVRIASLENNLDFSSARFAVLGNQGFDVTRSKTDFYPIVGARVGLPISNKLGFRVYGDYGGFGIGNNLQTWRAQGVFGYDICSTVRLDAGYSAVGFSGNSGNGVTSYRYNTTFHGPVFGASFKI